MVVLRVLRILQLFVALYVSTAVLYTTNCFLVSPLYACVSMLLDHVMPQLSAWSLPLLLQTSTRNIQIVHSLDSNSETWFGQSSKNIIHWNSSDFSLRHGLGHAEAVPMSEELFLSKAFANSVRPSKIIPFFYRATGNFDPDDITITTLITSNRFKVFAQLVERYHGPISVTIHVKNITAHINELLDSLHVLYTSSITMSTYVDVHLVIDSYDRQFNTWRNIARLFSRTDFVTMLDVDFSLCTNFRSAIRKSKAVMDKLREGHAALVVPAFEYVIPSEGADQQTFPRDKKSLLSLVKAKRIRMFHSSWALGHNSTDYERYYASSPGEIYKVMHYQSAYEPYVIFKKEGPPWCDERFVGYGGNKAACLFEMYLSGISYYVLTDHFIIHQNHLYEEVARKNERKSNRKVYLDFKEETCLRYLKSYHDNGILNTTRGFNVQEECKKIKGMSRIAAQVVIGFLPSSVHAAQWIGRSALPWIAHQ